MNIPINPILLFNIGLLLVAAGQIIFNWKAIKRTLSTVRDTLAKEKTLDLISYSGAIVGCGYIVWVIVRDWV